MEYLELQRALGAEILDFDAVERSSSRAARLLARRLGLSWGLAWLGLSRRNEFDHIYATGEDVGIPLAIFLSAARIRGKLTVVIHNGGTPKRLRILRALGHRAYRNVICLCAAQERVLRELAGLPAKVVLRLPLWTDHHFYKASEPVAGDYVLSVGMESRDYPTLRAAAATLPYRFHVVASGWSPGAGYGRASGIAEGENITIERGIETARLRELYAGCRFVVVPLRRVTYAAGVTGIVEGMAMGKAVIASASPGIIDYTNDGVSGRVVPVGDAAALRAAIVELWEDPERVARMGRFNREWVEREINMDAYVEKVARLLGAN